MRLILTSLAAAGLMAGAAMAQDHALVPGSDQIVNPSSNYEHDPNAATPTLPASPGLQSGIAGDAAGGNDFPRPYPQPGSQAGVSSTADALARAVNASGTVRDYPLSWNGSGSDWWLHSAACTQRYRRYDPATDTFELRKGVRAMCPANVR